MTSAGSAGVPLSFAMLEKREHILLPLRQVPISAGIFDALPGQFAWESTKRYKACARLLSSAQLQSFPLQLRMATIPQARVEV